VTTVKFFDPDYIPDGKLTYSVIELYHGKIEVESTPGTGSVFIVTFPKKPVTIT